MRPYEELNIKLQQKFRSFEAMEGLTVAKHSFEEDQLVIVWNDGTYSRLTIESSCDYCDGSDAGIADDHFHVGYGVRTAGDMGIATCEEINAAITDLDKKRMEEYKASRLAEFNRLKQELGL